MRIEWQTWVVALLVAGSFVRAAWALMPQTVRRTLARHLVHWPWPSKLKVFFTQAALTSDGCHCTGCAHAAVGPGKAGTATAPESQVILFQRRKKPRVSAKI